MSALVAIASRELRLRRSVLLLALALGCVPVAVSFYGPGILLSTATGATGAAMIAGLSMLVITSLSSGWSTIASEGSSGRLGFFFARPVPWWAIWGGKLGAAVGLSIAAALLATLPSLATAFGQWRALVSASNGPALLGFALLPLLVVGLANAASTAFRGQPAWRAFDMVLSAAFLYLLLRPSRLLTVGAWSLGGETPYAVLQAPLALALVAGSAMQVRAGRMESRRSHALLSLTVWSLSFASLGTLAAVGYLMSGASPSHLRSVTWVETPPRGGWIFVAGPVRWGQYSAAFLYEPASGRHISLGSARRMSRASFSPDGSMAVLNEADIFDPATRRTRVVWLDGGRRGIEKIFDFLPEEVSISPKGEYLIAFREARYPGYGRSHVSKRLDFYKLPSCGLINSLTTSALGLGDGGASSETWFRLPVAFQADGRLRVYVEQGEPGRTSYVQIVTADLSAFLAAGTARAPTLAPTGGFPVGKEARLRTSATGDRVMVQEWHPRRRHRPWRGRGYEPPGSPSGWTIDLHDGVTGGHLGTLVEGAEVADADFLSDGRIVLAATDAENAWLHLVEPDGGVEHVKDVNLGPGEDVVLAGEVSGDPGLSRIAEERGTGSRWLLVGVRRSAREFGRTAAVELTQFGWVGTFRRGFYPASLKAGSETTRSRGMRPAPGSLGSRLLISEQGGLVRDDPERGTVVSRYDPKTRTLTTEAAEPSLLLGRR